MRKLLVGLISVFVFLSCQESNSELWDFDNLVSIGGHSVVFEGNPEIVETDLGLATYFDGGEDRLLIDANPIAGSEKFTVELVFKADDAYETNPAPRFVHIQDPNDSIGKRLMMELRINNRGQIYLDGYLKTDIDKFALIDSALTHPCNVWQHAVVTYDGKTLKTYMNGQFELEKEVAYENAVINPTGQTSIGARMNQVAYFKGYVKCLKVTRDVLEPSEFMVLN